MQRRTFMNLTAGAVVAFDPFVAGSPACPALCDIPAGTTQLDLLKDVLALDPNNASLAAYVGALFTIMFFSAIGTLASSLTPTAVAAGLAGFAALVVLQLADRMGVAAEAFRLDFFGGTMFWVRPEALALLRKLELSKAFPEEKGLLDGGLEHALERLFGVAVVAAGYSLADSDGIDAASGACARSVRDSASTGGQNGPNRR